MPTTKEDETKRDALQKDVGGEKQDVELAEDADPVTKYLQDPAQAAFAQYFTGQDDAWRKEYEKRVVRKVDTRLLPMLIIMYLLNFLDRSNLAQARQGTLEEDLDMKGTDFNLATSIFFIGYVRRNTTEMFANVTTGIC